MLTFISAAARFVREEDAPTMLEYGLLLALVVLVVAGTVNPIGDFCFRVFHETLLVASSR